MAIVDGGTVLLNGQATVTPPAANLFIQSVAASVAGDAVISGDIIATFSGMATISGDAQVSATSTALRQASATLAGDATVNVPSNEPIFLLSPVALAGQGTFSASGMMAYAGVSNLAGEAVLTAATQAAYAAAAALAGDAEMTSTAVMAYAAESTVSGDATIMADALGDDEGAADLYGSSDISASMNVSYSDSIALSGGSRVVAIGIVRPPLQPPFDIPQQEGVDPFAGLRIDRPPHARISSVRVSTTARTQLVDVDETEVSPQDRIRKVPRNRS